MNKITNHLLGNRKYFVYSYCRTLDYPAGRRSFSTDGSLVNPILNYDKFTSSAMDASVNVVMNAMVPVEKEYKAGFK